MVWDEQLDFEAIGTKWVIDIKISTKINKNQLLIKILEEIKGFSRIFSRFDNNSQIILRSQSSGVIKIPKKYQQLIKLYENLYKLSEGLFTPLVGNLLEEAGYDRNYSLKPRKLNPLPKWEAVINYNFPNLKIKKPWILDFGAGGKGFLVDIVSNILIKEGVKEFCVDAGGDMYYQTTTKEVLRVGLENPTDTNQVIGVARVMNQSICGSSINRRKWDNFHHIFNPRKLDSENEVLAAWVIAENGLLADSLCTCLFLLDPAILRQKFDFEYLILYPNFNINKSKDFPGEIFYN